MTGFGRSVAGLLLATSPQLFAAAAAPLLPVFEPELTGRPP